MADSKDIKDMKEPIEVLPGEITKPTSITTFAPSLRRVPGKIPLVALLILAVEVWTSISPFLFHPLPLLTRIQLGERFTYFGLSGPIQNYIKNAPGGSLPGALGKGQATATALGNFFKFWAYASTVIGAVVADAYLGKFKTIVLACCIYTAGLILLVGTATPAGLASGAGMGGLVAAMVTIGLGTGGIKANVTPMCAEQYGRAEATLKTLPSGEVVVVDPALTVQKLFMWFYWVVNVGALSPLITVNVEAKHSFWLAYLIPLIAIVISTAVFLSGSSKYIKTPPQGSALLDAARVTGMAWREGRSFEKATPTSLAARGRLPDGEYAEKFTDDYVHDVARGLRSCKMFLFLPFYFVCWIQIWNNLISQAGDMALHGTPNDLLQNLDPIALIIFLPLLDFVVYPLLRKYKINFDPVARIFVGFLFASLAMVYASVLQHYIYTSPAQSIHVWIQAPAYVLVALSEAFVIVTGLELAYTQAPANLRSVVSSLFWLTIGIAAALAISISSVSQDQYLVWMYGSLAIVGFVAGVAFLACFWGQREGLKEVVIEGEEVGR